MKKVIAALGLIILSLFAVGCEKTIDLTDEENRIIAEYAAELLLKYDRNLDSKYYDSIEKMATEDIFKQEPVTEKNTEDNTTVETTTEGNNNDVQLPEKSTESSTETSTGQEKKDVIDAREFDLGSFMGLSGISIKYSHYMIADSYPSYDKDGVYIEIEAPDGYKLLVLKFDIENLANQSQNVDLYALDMGYYIIVNDEKTAKQMLTILLDDLYTYQKELGKGDKEEAVLIFQMSDSVARYVTNLKLGIKSGDREQTISLN